MMNRLFISMPDDMLETFEEERKILQMNRSQYVRYLMANGGDLRPASIRFQKMIDYLSEIQLSLRVIAMKDSISDDDRLYIAKQIDEIKKILDKRYTFGQNDQKS